MKELAERVAHIATHGTVAHYLDERTVLEEAASDPKLAAAIRTIDPVKLLQRQLQAGLLDEWRWPALDEARELLGDVADHVGGPLPYLTLFNAKRTRIVVAGPAGIVLDKPLKLPAKAKGIRNAAYVDSDVLVIYQVKDGVYEGVWASGGKPFKTDILGALVELPGVGVIDGSPLLPLRGGLAKKRDFRGIYKVYSEDGRVFRHLNGQPIEEFDPATGKAKKAVVPPAFKARVKAGDVLVPECSYLVPVPTRAARSPLGGSGMLVVKQRKDGTKSIERGDGAKWSGKLPRPEDADHLAGLPRALVNMPERDGAYLAVVGRRDGWTTLLLPDGRTVVAKHPLNEWWAGVPEVPWPLTIVDYLHNYEPRDPAASRALRDLSEADAKQLLAATESIDVSDENAAKSPALAKAIRAVFPKLSKPAGRDDQLALGIAAMCVRAAEMQARHRELLGRVDEVAAEAAQPAEKTKWSDDSTDAWNELFPPIVFGDRVEGQDLRRQLRAVDRFLFDDEPPPSNSGPASLVWWEPLFLQQGNLVYRMFAPATPDHVREQFRELLGLWATTQMAKRCDELRYIGLTLPKHALGKVDFRRPIFVDDRNRYVYRFKHISGGDNYYVVERGKQGKFITPPKAKLLFDERPAKFWHGKLDAALALYDKRGAFEKIDKAHVDAIAKATKLSFAAAAMVWSGAVGPWKGNEDKILKSQLGLKVPELKAAYQKQVQKVALDKVYSLAMPEDPKDLFGGAAVDRFISAWKQVK